MSEKEIVKTVNKHYSFFKKDIEIMNFNGWTPKEVLALGVIAKLNNPQMLQRIKIIEQDIKYINHRISSFSKVVLDLNYNLRKLKEDNKLK